MVVEVVVVEVEVEVDGGQWGQSALAGLGLNSGPGWSCWLLIVRFQAWRDCYHKGRKGQKGPKRAAEKGQVL